MAEYMFLIYGDEAGYADATEEDWALMMKAHAEFGEQVMKLGGTISEGNALAPTPTATSVRVQSGGSHVVTDGPFAETKEALGGYYVVGAKDLDEAISFAKLVPTTGCVEVRPVIDTSGG